MLMNQRQYPQVTGTIAAASEEYLWPFDNAGTATNVYARVDMWKSVSFGCTNTGASNAITASLIEGCWGDPDTDENWVALASGTLTPAVDATEADEIELAEHGFPKYLRVTLTSSSGTTFALDAIGRA